MIVLSKSDYIDTNLFLPFEIIFTVNGKAFHYFADTNVSAINYASGLLRVASSVVIVRNIQVKRTTNPNEK
jgi:hypothetical protein